MRANISQQVKAWFYNKTAKRGGGTVKLLFHMGLAVGPKLLSEEQMYSKLFYDTRLKSIIDEEVKELAVPAEERLAFANQRIGEMYGEETKDVKTLVQETIEKQSLEKKAMARMLKAIFEDEAMEEFKPEEYAL